MKRTLIILLAGLAATPLAAQPDLKVQDRHPDMIGEPLPKTVRTIPIGPVHTFEQRWEPVEQLLREQRAREHLPRRSNAPTASAAHAAAVPLPTSRRTFPSPRAANEAVASALTDAIAASKPSIRRPDQATCLRHKLRTVWTGQSWRCRR